MPPRRRMQVVTARPAPESRSQRITTAVTAVAAIGALLTSTVSIYYTGRSVDATHNQVRLQEQGQVTDRFARAVEQLGADQVNVRLGAIYSLERLMRDSPQDQSTIEQVLCGFVRERAKNRRHGYDAVKKEWPKLTKFRPTEWPKPATDVQAAVTVLGRRPASPPPSHRATILDLSDTDLSLIDLSQGNFAFTDFQGSSLVRADMLGVNLVGANLYIADLAGASITFGTATNALFAAARMDGGSFDETDFSGTNLTEVDGAGSSFGGANLTDANFREANLADAMMEQTQLRDADFSHADLRGATLDGAQNFAPAACVEVSETTRLPAGTNPPRC